jgi:hypothetical protein
MVAGHTTDSSSPLSSSRGHDDTFLGAETNSVDSTAHDITSQESKNEETAHLHEDERVHLELWLKDCAELRSVEFLSGRAWYAVES